MAKARRQDKSVAVDVKRFFLSPLAKACFTYKIGPMPYNLIIYKKN